MDESLAQTVKNLLWPPRLTTADQRAEYAERLAGVLAARPVALTKEEYAEVRAEVLGELTSFPKMHGRVKGILAVACFGCVAFIIYGMVTHRHRFIVDPIVPLSVASLIWWCQGRDCAVKRALGRTDRLEIVDELVRRNLVSPEEAAALRTAIERLFEYKRAASREGSDVTP